MMKKLLIFFTILFLSQSIILSQIPNGGFENWTDGNPDNWSTNNVPSFATPVTQSSDAHSGAFAVKMEVLQTTVGGFSIPLGPAMVSNFFPVSQRYANFTGFFQFSPAYENDSLSLVISFYDDNSPVGIAYLSINQTLSNYTEVTVPIEYSSGATPDSAFITAAIAWDSLNSVGTYALIDDLTLEGIASSIEEITANVPKGFDLKQNYPNPFNPSTNIEYSIPKGSFVELKVYDIIGNEVAVLVSQFQDAGTYRVGFSAKEGYNLTSGIYIARFSAGNFIRSIKMTLLK